MKYQMKYIMKMPELKIIGKFTMNHFSIITNRILELINNNSFSQYINDLSFYYNTGNRYIKTNYFFDLIKFFLEDTGDETIENNKRKEVNKNNAFYACLAAGILNEEEFSYFLDRFDIDINGQINEITPLFCSIKNKEDTLKIILEKFKDEIDINYCAPTQNISAFHILCGMPIIYNKQGCKLFLQMKDLKINVIERKNLYSPLRIAIISNNHKMASFLINQPGIDVNLPDYDNKKISKNTITTIFEEAIRHNMNDIAEELVKKPDYNGIGAYSYSYISLPNNYSDSYYYYYSSYYASYPRSLINFFIKVGFFSSIVAFFGKLLTKTLQIFNAKDDIDKYKLKLFKKNVAFLTCLAARYLSVNEFIKFLDNYDDIDINAVAGDTEATPLFSSILNEYDTLNVILNRFKNVDINYKTSKDVTALHLISLCFRGKFTNGTLLFFQKDFKNINLQEDINYNTPLHIAIKKHYLELIQKLLNHPNIDLDITNKERYTPLRLFVTEMGQMMWNNNNKENVISILECFAKHQDLKYTNKILSYFQKEDYDRLRKSKILAEQLQI